MASVEGLFRMAKAKGPKGEAITPEEEKSLLENTELEPISNEPIRTMARRHEKDKDKEEEKDRALFRKARKRGDSQKDTIRADYISENN
jgi:hypothetical protein